MRAVPLAGLLSEEGRRDPYPHYAELHRHGQAAPIVPGESQYSVVVYGYDAVNEVLRDPRYLMTDAEQIEPSRPDWRDHPALYTLLNSVFFANGERHTRMRRTFNQVFTARRVAALRPAMARLADELLDRLAELGASGTPVEFMAEFAFPFPANVIGELLGVPTEDRAWFRPRVLSIGRILELGGGTAENMAVADRGATELTGYFAELADKRRAEPRDDLISALVVDDTQLDETELLANLITLFNAGFVTTTHLMGNGLALLLARPHLADALRERPELAERYVEEILRYEPPTHFVIRRASVDADIAGVPVPAGSAVLILLGAANRDPVRFPRPDEFDGARDDGLAMAFSAGPHFCMGAALSRAEGQVALPRLLRRFPALALAGEPVGGRQLMLRGFDSMLVTTG